MPDEFESKYISLGKILQILWEVEKFYDAIGGLVGYHLTVLRLMIDKYRDYQNNPSNQIPSCRYLKPKGIDISQDTLEVRKMILKGIENLPHCAEMYPVGGAGDRLHLKDENSGVALPSAKLFFCGKTLLEGLIQDLQAREYLYYKIYLKQITTPVVLMTSHEKNNYQHVFNIFEEKNWFDRSNDSFLFLVQPLAPMVTIHGEWSISSPFHLTLKPGGHGAIWKLAKDKGAFDWLRLKGRSKILLRQINNPVAGTDFGLLAFLGVGFHSGKKFGFSSCHRLVKMAEGMNVIVERKVDDGYEYRLSNIEYTDFQKYGIEDIPEGSDSGYSLYPANTNILFADIGAVEWAIEKMPIPGMLVNMKGKAPMVNSMGDIDLVESARLESTMQNLADCFIDKASFPLQFTKEGIEHQQTFITYGDRAKTISVTKNAFQEGKSINETPEGCFYDVLQNYYELLTVYCGFILPKLFSREDYLDYGPNFITLFHPAIGPLYSIIKQKIRGGFIEEKSELQLDISEIDIENLYLKGSLLVKAERILGHKDASSLIQYSENVGRCVLHNVRVINKGVRRKKQIYWQNQLEREESLRIELNGLSEFYAKDVTFKGNLLIQVPHGFRLTAYQVDDQVKYHIELIQNPTWWWSYAVNENYEIVLNKNTKEEGVFDS